MGRIQISDLFFAYQSASPVFEGISFEASGDVSVGVIGQNGAGKSTLLKLLAGLLYADSGEVVVDGEKMSSKTAAGIRRKEGFVFQDAESQLFMGNVYEDVAFAPRNYGYTPDEVKERSQKALELTGITDLKDRQIYRLSGGEKKLVSIATVLSVEPEIILMDEPSVALDPMNRDRLIEIVRKLPGLRVIASHDLDFIYDTCKRTVVLHRGRIVWDGETERILKDRALLEQYGLKLPLSFRFSEDTGREQESL